MSLWDASLTLYGSVPPGQLNGALCEGFAQWSVPFFSLALKTVILSGHYVPARFCGIAPAEDNHIVVYKVKCL